jgi:hypothetical protein
MFERISYDKLNPRQKEDYNFHQVAARLAGRPRTMPHAR